MRFKFVLLTGLLVLGASCLMGQTGPWVNPGTSSSPSSCAPFHDQSAGTTAYYCYYGGNFPWYAAGASWTTVLRIAAPASGAIQVKYDFYQQNADGSIDPAQLDYVQFGATSLEQSSEVVFDLAPNTPSELTLLGKSSESPRYTTSATGSVHVEVRCPDKATCAAVMPQLIYSALPGVPWYLSGALSSDISLPTQPDSTVWSAVGVNDPQPKNSDIPNQQISFVILNDSGIDQQYTVSVYDKTGALIGSKVVSVKDGRNLGLGLTIGFIPNLPVGLLKLRVAGVVSPTSGVDGPRFQFTALQFKGAAATALVPVAEAQ